MNEAFTRDLERLLVFENAHGLVFKSLANVEFVFGETSVSAEMKGDTVVFSNGVEWTNYVRTSSLFQEIMQRVATQTKELIARHRPTLPVRICGKIVFTERGGVTHTNEYIIRVDEFGRPMLRCWIKRHWRKGEDWTLFPWCSFVLL